MRNPTQAQSYYYISNNYCKQYKNRKLNYFKQFKKNLSNSDCCDDHKFTKYKKGFGQTSGKHFIKNTAKLDVKTFTKECGKDCASCVNFRK